MAGETDGRTWSVCKNGRTESQCRRRLSWQVAEHCEKSDSGEKKREREKEMEED